MAVAHAVCAIRTLVWGDVFTTLEELIACSGTQFDPTVVESFCHVLAARNLNQAVAEAALPPQPAG